LAMIHQDFEGFRTAIVEFSYNISWVHWYKWALR
jgi:hypothetical protein